MDQLAFQDYYSDDVSHCYGCGRLNEHGLQIQSYWEGEEAVCRFRARPYHTAIPGYVYGGLIASLIDCHSTGTAAAAAYREAGRPMGSDPQLRYVTASLQVDYIRPTPIEKTLLVRAKVTEMKGRKIIVTSSLFVGDEECARGKVIVVQLPENWLAQSLSG
jgi:acyl-coenzyme A thioesterase PaaI-like protein